MKTPTRLSSTAHIIPLLVYKPKGSGSTASIPRTNATPSEWCSLRSFEAALHTLSFQWCKTLFNCSITLCSIQGGAGDLFCVLINYCDSWTKKIGLTTVLISRISVSLKLICIVLYPDLIKCAMILAHEFRGTCPTYRNDVSRRQNARGALPPSHWLSVRFKGDPQSHKTAVRDACCV